MLARQLVRLSVGMINLVRVMIEPSQLHVEQMGFRYGYEKLRDHLESYGERVLPADRQSTSGSYSHYAGRAARL